MIVYGLEILPLLILGAVLDRLLGEPEAIWSRVPHPAVLLGRVVAALESRLNVGERRLARGFAALAIVLALAAACGVFVAWLSRLAPWLIVVEIVAVAALLAQRSLIDHVLAVADALERDVDAARAAVGLIVGRDVSAADPPAISRAAIESCAENLSDGVIAPAILYGLFGLPGLLVYKAANTADSMIGYREPRFLRFGRAAARSDDVLNWLPARFTALAIALTSPVRTRAILRIARADAPAHASPNAGWPEAAMAARLDVALGGPRRYRDHQLDGAWLNGEGERDATAASVREATRVADAAWLLVLALAAMLALALA